MCVLTEDDYDAHPGGFRELAFRIPPVNNYASWADLHRYGSE